MEQTEHFTTKKKKEVFIEAYKLNNDVSKSCKIARIGRTTYYRWMKQSAFKDKLDEAVEELRDKIESKLIENALSGDPKHNSCLIFYCKTKMKKRGYIEKSELDISDERTRIIIKEPYDDKRDTLDPKQEASPSIETTEG